MTIALLHSDLLAGTPMGAQPPGKQLGASVSDSNSSGIPA